MKPQVGQVGRAPDVGGVIDVIRMPYALLSPKGQRITSKDARGWLGATPIYATW